MDYRILNPDNADYPLRLKERLGTNAPVLYARGRLDYLSRWTMAFFTADVEPGLVTRAVWDMFRWIFSGKGIYGSIYGHTRFI
jgi:hypothetical protein